MKWPVCPRLALLALCVFSPGANSAQEQDRNVFWLAWPLAFHAPETRWGIGAGGVCQFYWKQRDSLSIPSQVQLTAAVTQNRQAILSIPFQLFFGGRTHQVYGECTYNRFHYTFFGINQTAPARQEEQYEEEFPLIRIHYLGRVHRNLYAGVRWWYEDHTLLSTEPGGLLQGSSLTGADGGRAGGPGVVGLLDTRDNVYSAHTGHFVEMSWHIHAGITGSEFDFQRWRMDLRAYRSPHPRHVLAGQVLWETMKGQVPWFQLSALGSDRRLRGYYNGYFRGMGMLLAQVEWRPQITRKLGGAVFLSSARMGSRAFHFQERGQLWSGGLGLRYRLTKSGRAILRFNAAWGPHSTGYYFTVGEAF